MREKVKRVTEALLKEGRGDADATAQIFSNFTNQLAVQPFVSNKSNTPQHRFGQNAVDTIQAAKAHCIKPGSPADMLRRSVLVSGAYGPLSKKCPLSMAELARLGRYGNRKRVRALFKAKKSSKSIQELMGEDAVAGNFKPRCDKMAGDPIWTLAWHTFMAVKKGQSFRCHIVKTARVKVGSKYVWETEWARHQKRYMSMKMREFHAAVLKWSPYLEWRETYLSKNPKVSRDWHVGEKRLYREKCWCIDKQEAVRKCGCEIHLKMEELIAALLHWRRQTRSAILRSHPKHSCSVHLLFNFFFICATSLIDD